MSYNIEKGGGFSVGRRVNEVNPAREMEPDVTPATTRIIR